MGLFTIYYAKLWNEKGEFIKKVFFPRFAKTFKWEGRAFNVKTNKASYETHSGIIYNSRFYHYNISNPDPLLLDKKCSPVMDPEDYNTMLETKQLQKLNEINQGGLLSKLLKDPKIIIIGLVVLGVGYWLLKGGHF